jgi:putative redox protein
MKTHEYTFPNADGHALAAKLDLPVLGNPRAYALLSHCFTCSKDLHAVRHISKALTDLGIGVFRFDFPSLGQSGGQFSETTFSTNVDDLYRASQFL